MSSNFERSVRQSMLPATHQLHAHNNYMSGTSATISCLRIPVTVIAGGSMVPCSPSTLIFPTAFVPDQALSWTRALLSSETYDGPYNG